MIKMGLCARLCVRIIYANMHWIDVVVASAKYQSICGDDKIYKNPSIK